MNDSLKEVTDTNEDGDTQTSIITTLTCAICEYFVKIISFCKLHGGGDYEESGPSYKMQVLEFGSSFQNSLTKEVAAWGLPRVDRRTMLRRIAREMARQMWRSRIL